MGGRERGREREGGRTGRRTWGKDHPKFSVMA